MTHRYSQSQAHATLQGEGLPQNTFELSEGPLGKLEPYVPPQALKDATTLQVPPQGSNEAAHSEDKKPDPPP